MNHRRFLLPSLILAVGACSGEDWRPDGHLQSETTELVRYDSCDALERDLKESLIREAWASIERAGEFRGGVGEDSAGGGAPPNAGGDRQEGVDYSGTNNQEEGVDEADFVKTDGFHVYSLNGNRLHIFAVPQFGQLQPVSTTLVEGRPGEMLIHKEQNRVIVFSTINSTKLPPGHPLRTRVGRDDQSWYWRVQSVGKVTVFDVTDRAAPRTEREFYFEGNYQTARRIDTSIRVVTYASLDRPEVWNWYDDYERYGEDRTKRLVARRIEALSLADLIPQIYARTAGDDLETHSLSQGSCASFLRPTDSHGRGISSILSFDLSQEALVWDADHVISNWATFYASKDQLVIAENAHDWWWYWWWKDDSDQLNVHTFDISQPGVATYLGSGRVRGQLSNQFAIDEEKGAIRLATTTDLWWRWWSDDDREPSTSHVWVLERRPDRKQLDVVGHVGGIAPGEHLTAARFLGDKGYLVTFRQIDPLFTVDLSDNKNPRVVGELKVPGFSTYLHPIADGKLLTVGVGGDNGGANWRTTVSLFDVSNLAQPTVTSSVPIAADGGWGWSQALYEHKAFTYFAPKKLLALPQSNYEYKYVGGREEYRYLSKLELVEVDPVAGLTRKGAVDHTAYYQAEPYYRWWNTDISRSIFMGDYVYAVSDKAISVHRTSDLGLVADELLPGTKYDEWWWGCWGL